MRIGLPVAAITLALITGCTPATGIVGTTSASTSAEQGTKTVSVPKLSILLTNDDGWKAPGIRAVYAALAAAGHDVTVVAPSANQSGASGRKTFWGDLVVAHPDLVPYPEYSGAKVWSVGPVEGKTGGSPADSVSFGLGTVFKDKKPDLVVSGTNLGQNTGGVTNNSGTVGAVAEAIESGIPSIAVSTEIKADYDPADESIPDFKPTADYPPGLSASWRSQLRAGRSFLRTPDSTSIILGRLLWARSSLRLISRTPTLSTTLRPPLERTRSNTSTPATRTT